MSGDHQSLLGAIAGALCCLSAFECNLAFDKYGGILVWIGLMLYMFKALGTICDEYFVPSLEVIVDKLQLSNDVAGATFMAAGSSAPELFTSLVATFLIVNEGGVGTIVGSAIFNILVIVGATGVIACKDQVTGAPKPLKIWWYPLSRDCFFYSLSIVELMVVISDEEVMWYEGLIMFLTYILYCVYMKFNPAIVAMLGLVDPRSLDEVEAVEDSAAGITVQKVEVTTTTATTTTTAGATAEDGSALKATSEADQSAKQPEVNVPAKEEAVAIDVVKTGEPDKIAVTDSPAVDKDAVETLKDQPAENQLTVAKAAGAPNQLMAPQTSPREVRRPSWSYAGGIAQEKIAEAAEQRKPSKEGEVGASENKEPAPDAEPQDEEDGPKGLFGTSFLRDPLLVFWELTMPNPETAGGGLLFALSILFIGICTYLMVDSTSRVGVIVHIPPLAMALVFLAAGTSIPDALGSIAVAKQGEGDMAVCNALGSNVFDILVGLGIPWLIKTGIMGKQVLFVGKWDELIYDIFVLIAVLFFFVGSLLANRWYLTRKVGFILLGGYVCFLIYNVLAVWVIDPPLKTQAPEDGTCVPI